MNDEFGVPIITRTAKIHDGVIDVKWLCRDKSFWFTELDFVKQITGRLFVPNLKIWSVPENSENIQLLTERGYVFENSEIENIVDDWTAPWLTEELTKNIPEYLRDYQIETMRFLKYRNGRGLIADDMGSGKTVQALAFLQMSKQLPALIVVPATIKRQWYREFRKFLDPENLYNIDILSGQSPYQLQVDTTYIINWDILFYWLDVLLRMDFKVLIADEAHRVSNTKSKRTKALKKLAKKIPYFLPLTGTPIKAKPKQFFTLLNLLDPENFNSEWSYLQRYCNPKHNGFGWSYEGASNLDELYSLVRNVMIRREKKDIMKDLPEKQYSVIPLDTSENREYYEESLKAFQESSGIAQGQAFSNLKLEAFGLKQDFIVQWLNDFIESGKKIFVGTYHRKAIEFLHDNFKDNSVMIYGGVSADEREGAIQKFKTDEKIKIMFGQILSAGEGIDGLQDVCSDCAFVEFAHNPADHNQFEDRLHRGDQRDVVNIYYLIANDTIEEDLVVMIDHKKSVVNKIVSGRETEETEFIGFLKNKYSEKN